MKQETVSITVKQKGKFLEWVHLVVGLVLEGVIPLGACLAVLRDLVAQFAADRLPKDEASEPKRNLAEEVRAAFEKFYLGLGFVVPIPIPMSGGKLISNREIRRRAPGDSAGTHVPSRIEPCLIRSVHDRGRSGEVLDGYRS